MNKFNVRVYGILIHDGKLLISDEYIKGNNITKLPGGGLEFGEGIKECLVREFKEELNLDIEVLTHFYTTDFFVTSAFNTRGQLISIYYKVKATSNLDFKISNKLFDFDKIEEGAQCMRWVDLKMLSEDTFTFIIDKRIAELLCEEN